MDTFRFRLNCIDHYQTAPTKLDPVLRRRAGATQLANAPHVPVIRAFGATETGQKVCAHIHGALPYLYLEYDGSLEEAAVNTYISSLRSSIDHALAATYRRNPYDGKSLYVGHITLVKGVPFYGYHVGYKVFLKVYMLNPVHMTRFADLLYQGAILNHVFQPYESHMQYLLQWMCDYNLYGCAYIDCAKVRFRSPVPDSDMIDTALHKWHDGSISLDLLSSPENFPRLSHCTLEVDVCVEDILNRHEVKQRPIHHDFLERFNLPTADDKFVPSMAGLWRDETRRRKLRMGLTDPSSSPFPAEVLVSMSADPRNTTEGGWIHEEEYRGLVEELVQQEKNNRAEVKFDSFVKPIDGLSDIRTAIESIEDLYPDKLALQQDEEHPEPCQVHTEEPCAVDLQQQHDAELQQVGDAVVEEGQQDEADEMLDDEVDEQPSLDPLSLSEALQHKPGTHTSDKAYNDIHVEAEDVSSESDRSDSSIKRALGDGEAAPLKRRRVLETVPASASKRVTFHSRPSDMKNGHIQSASGGRAQNGQPWPSQSSQSSIKAQGTSDPTTLAFPVVKNANAPDTILRLSQSGYSNSQEAPKTPKIPAPIVTEQRHSKTSPVTPWSHQTGSPFTTSAGNMPGPSPQAISLVKRMTTGRRLAKGTYFYGHLPPTSDFVRVTLAQSGLPSMIYQDAYYSDEMDVPERPREYAGREFKLQSTTLPYLPSFDSTGASAAASGEAAPVLVDKAKEDVLNRLRSQKCSLRHWQLSVAPPSRSEVVQWLGDEARAEPVKMTAGKAKTTKPIPKALSQVEGPTQHNRHGFKYSQKKKTSVKHETQYMSIMSLEVHVNSRGSLVPDPAEDQIQSIFWCIQGEEDATTDSPRVGILTLSDEGGIGSRIAKQVSVEMESEEDELDLINRLVDIVREFDPDILTGYEVHNSSWGYLIERARLKFEYDLCDEISRMISQSHGRFGKEADRWGFTHTSTIRVTGRHMINIWRAMRGELNLLQYTMENVVFHLLHKRIPHYSHADLTAWYQSCKPRDLAKVLDYFVTRVQLNLDVLEANEIVPRTSEQARLLGVDFFSVISRGSQFKVESTMLRIAKPENFILVSPSRKQVGQQNALECLPLVMEPQSAFYNSPLLVLDFQSLYPSVMIAYNYCYSTCLGRIVSWRGRNKMGFMDFKREPQLLELVKDYINIAPNGMMYVKPEMRKSLLAKMLGELLETRVMVKSGMKQDKDDKTLQQLLNNRQLALKLLANVTYGYTSASFSGRMPCSEIADSIVQTGRETLEKAIALIHSNSKWNAEVVYGDTDSLFVYLKGRTRDEAFNIGEEIAAAVTKTNPRPVKLKFEKVYHPCVLLAKKRYVGFKYESRNQQEPEFDAKGIETVRRDGTPAEQKIEEKALKILFRTADLSQVKSYFQAQCSKIMSGRISIQDFLFAKEVKLGTYSDRGPPPPGALIATKRMLADPRAEPQYGERVPYVVVTGAPGARLMDRCISPEILLQNDHIELDAEYYISKNLIPPLERIFNLVGANVRQWYDEMPKIHRIRSVTIPFNKPDSANAIAANPISNLKKTLESYMKSSACLVCRSKLPPAPAFSPGEEMDPMTLLPLCCVCLHKPARALLALRERMWKAEERVKQVDMVCRNCSGLAWGEEVKCDSRDCPVFYTRIREGSRLAAMKEGAGRVIEVLQDDSNGINDFDVGEALGSHGASGGLSESEGTASHEYTSDGLEW